MKQINLILLFSLFLISTSAQVHPNLILTADGVSQIKAGNNGKLFQENLTQTREQIDLAIKSGIDVPTPKDMAGGYTHQVHKQNWKSMLSSSTLFQITGEKRYAEYVKDMLYEYAAIYKTLPIHPTDRSYATGRLFWQCLNDSNWLVFTAQSYDNIHEYLSVKERDYLESELFIPYANFLSTGNPQFFNRIHNHSTWGIAAVGMIALVMDNDSLLDRALYGLKLSIADKNSKDNDGGFINDSKAEERGFFAQMDHAFSPDGYYTEGPYYQRYAMSPFMLFAAALDNNRKELKIFEYRDQLLIKAVKALIYQSDAKGEFFPINDAQKGMSLNSPALISSVAIAYGYTQDKQLIDVARMQNTVTLDHHGFAISKAIDSGDYTQMSKKSIELSDGAKGDEGALGILRSGEAENETVVAFKYTSQGLGHGHYDKLSYIFYDGPTEVLEDYGAARWVNIDQKAGGRYLKENKTWAKHTIAHNALIVDEKSHFNGVYKVANANHSEPFFFEVDDKTLQAASAKELNAYPGVEMHRTLLLWNEDFLKTPLLIDLYDVKSDDKHQYDLAYQYGEQLLKLSFDYDYNPAMEVFGEDHGFNHLYREATGEISEDNYQFNFFKERKFYTISGVSEQGDEGVLARLGANDPNFNLRKQSIFLHRKKDVTSTLFLSVIECHGTYSPVDELPRNPYSNVEGLKVLLDNEDYKAFSITMKDGTTAYFAVCLSDASSTKKHSIIVNKTEWSWTGPIHKTIQKK